MKAKDYYKEFEKLAQSSFEKIKSEYQQFVENVRIGKKEIAHNIFHNDVLEPRYKSAQNALDKYVRFLIEVKEAHELNKSKSISQIFNEKFNEIPKAEREKLIGQLGEYGGLQTMYRFWKLQERANESILELLLVMQPDLRNFLSAIYEEKKTLFISKLRTRIDRSEKNQFVTEEIKKVRENLENDGFNNIYNILNKPREQLLTLAQDIGTSFSDTAKLFPKEQPFSDPTFVALINKGLVEDVELNETDLREIFSRTEQAGFKGESFNMISESNNPVQTLFQILFHFHYEKGYLNFLFQNLQDLEQKNNIPEQVATSGHLKDSTTHRQVLAIHYLLNEFEIYSKTDKTEIAKFIQFLTGRETGAKNISDTTLYKKLKNPLGKGDKSLDEDLRFVRSFYEKLGLQTIADKITKEIASKE